MSDKLLDSTQVISGIAVLLSFFVGYKYGLRNISAHSEDETLTKQGSDSEKIRVSVTFKFKYIHGSNETILIFEL